MTSNVTHEVTHTFTGFNKEDVENELKAFINDKKRNFGLAGTYLGAEKRGKVWVATFRAHWFFYDGR